MDTFNHCRSFSYGLLGVYTVKPPHLGSALVVFGSNTTSASPSARWFYIKIFRKIAQHPFKKLNCTENYLIGQFNINEILICHSQVPYIVASVYILVRRIVGCCRILTFDMGKNKGIQPNKNIQLARLAGSASKVCVVGGDGCLGGCVG